jgi:molecular chaperone Hsp33
MNKDFLHKYLVMDRQARVITVFSTNTVNKYCKNIKTTPVGIAAMGRLISSTLMMGSMLKGKESVMVTINGNGPIGTIKAEADSNGNVRAYATNPMVDVANKENGMLDVAAAVGSEGYLNVRRQMNLKEPFIGTCELISGEIGEDLSYYFGTSEQTPTIVALGVLANKDGTCKQAGGFIIQLLPNASEEVYQFLEKMLREIKSVSKLIENAKTSDQLVYQLFDEAELIFEYPVDYKCNCSYDKTKLLLTQLTSDELDEEISKGKGLDVTCNLCQHVYHYDVEALKEIKEIKNNSNFQVK